jgi:hypothetical protein
MEVDAYIRACGATYEFIVPLSRSFSPGRGWKEQYKNSLNSEESMNLVGKLEMARNDIIDAFRLDVPWPAKLSSFDTYIPLLYQLHSSCGSAKKEFELAFEWKMTIANQETISKDGFFRNPDLIFEIFMVMFAKAISLNNYACSLMKIDPLNFVADAGKGFLAASSIMSYLADRLSNSVAWNALLTTNSKFPCPLEVSVAVCNGFAALFKATAQRVSVVKVIGNEAATPALLRSKLCLGVTSTSETALVTFSRIPNAHIFLLNVINIQGAFRELYTAMAHFYAGLAAFDKQEMGISLGHCIAAKVSLTLCLVPKYL